MIRRSVVPKQNVSVSELDELARRLRWKSDKQFNREAERYDTGQRAWKVDSETRVVLSANAPVAFSSLTVEAPDPTRVAELLEKAFACYDDAEIFHALRAAQTSDELIAALHLLGASAPRKFDPVVAEEVRRGAENGDAQVRLAAVVAASWLGWSELLQVVEHIAEHDPELVVRHVTSDYLIHRLRK